MFGYYFTSRFDCCMLRWQVFLKDGLKNLLVENQQVSQQSCKKRKTQVPFRIAIALFFKTESGTFAAVRGTWGWFMLCEWCLCGRMDEETERIWCLVKKLCPLQIYLLILRKASNSWKNCQCSRHNCFDSVSYLSGKNLEHLKNNNDLW